MKNFTVIGSGLVGSLLSIYLAKKGYQVTVYERRPDLRKNRISAGRSINLALSDRAFRSEINLYFLRLFCKCILALFEELLCPLLLLGKLVKEV